MTTQTMARKDEIASLLLSRATAADEIRNAPHMANTEWMADRIADINYANRKLIELGVIKV